MAKCIDCGTTFDVEDAEDEFNAEFHGNVDYNEYHSGERCGNCAIAETDSNTKLGRAILMMNGEEDYDADHVEKYL